MSGTVKCGLIQAKNAAPPEAPIEEIKRINVEKHLKLIEDAAKQGVKILHAGGLHYALFLRRAADTMV